jgi:toxin ParE1/3/4
VKEIVHDPEVKCDIIGAARFYEARLAGLGARFLKALDTTIMKVAANPEIYGYCKRPLRSCRVAGFPYRVIFAHETEFVLIVAVSHLARQPEWWDYRLDR